MHIFLKIPALDTVQISVDILLSFTAKMIDCFGTKTYQGPGGGKSGKHVLLINFAHL